MSIRRLAGENQHLDVQCNTKKPNTVLKWTIEVWNQNTTITNCIRFHYNCMKHFPLSKYIFSMSLMKTNINSKYHAHAHPGWIFTVFSLP